MEKKPENTVFTYIESCSTGPSFSFLLSRNEMASRVSTYAWHTKLKRWCQLYEHRDWPGPVPDSQREFAELFLVASLETRTSTPPFSVPTTAYRPADIRRREA